MISNYPKICFSDIKKFVKEIDILHPYLKDSLLKNNIRQLRPFQSEMLYAASDNKNCFVNSCTGSGKTFAYLIPVMNQIIKNKQSPSKDGSHGSIILTLNKELVLQIYKWIRILDPQNRISAKRTGPISHFLPVITQLNNRPKSRYQLDEIDRKINQNIVNTVKWSTTDILISTPQLLSNIISMSVQKQPLDPYSLVIDQADLLLQIDNNVKNHTQKVIVQIQKRRISKQFLISASSFPKKMNKKPYQEALLSKFKDIVFIQGQQKHRIPDNIELYSIDLENMNPVRSKDYYLKDIISVRENEKIIIFCNNKKSLDEVKNIIQNTLSITCLQYHASLDSNERSRVLHKFDQGQQNILISTDLGSRGLDFQKPINLIIQYQMSENATVFMNRVGRTGRGKLPGQVITFVEKKDRQLFEHLSQLVQNDNQLDQVFSRKRSYRKLYKKKNNDQQ